MPHRNDIMMFGRAQEKREGGALRYDREIVRESAGRKDDPYWVGSTSHIRLMGVLEALDYCVRQDFYFEIPSEAAAELAQLIRDEMDASQT